MFCKAPLVKISCLYSHFYAKYCALASGIGETLDLNHFSHQDESRPCLVSAIFKVSVSVSSLQNLHIPGLDLFSLSNSSLYTGQNMYLCCKMTFQKTFWSYINCFSASFHKSRKLSISLSLGRAASRPFVYTSKHVQKCCASLRKEPI